MNDKGMNDEMVKAAEMAEAAALPRDEHAINSLADVIRETGYQIHRYFGIGYLEKVYENAMKHRLEKLGHSVLQQVNMAVRDEDGYDVGLYQADLVVDQRIIIELKAVRSLNGSHEAQLISYLKTTGIKDGMLINFGSEKFQVIKRVCDLTKGSPKFVFDNTPQERR